MKDTITTSSPSSPDPVVPYVAHDDLLSVIRITVTPVPVDSPLPGVQLNESPSLVALGLIPLVRAVFVGVPVVIVLVALVVVTLVVLALSIFVVPIVLRAGSGDHRSRCSKGSSQKKRTEISVSTVHVGLLWREIHIRRIPLTSLSALGAPKAGQYCSNVLIRRHASRATSGRWIRIGPSSDSGQMYCGVLATTDASPYTPR
jgi:hypothetical protein